MQSERYEWSYLGIKLVFPLFTFVLRQGTRRGTRRGGTRLVETQLKSMPPSAPAPAPLSPHLGPRLVALVWGATHGMTFNEHTRPVVDHIRACTDAQCPLYRRQCVRVRAGIQHWLACTNDLCADCTCIEADRASLVKTHGRMGLFDAAVREFCAFRQSMQSSGAPPPSKEKREEYLVRLTSLRRAANNCLANSPLRPRSMDSVVFETA